MKLTYFIRLLSLLCISIQFAEANTKGLELEVIDPFIEIHTGPGAGYPVFFTIEQGETVELLTRRTGWYELKLPNGHTGWAKASQIARTLLPTGEPVDLPSISFGDYLKDRWRAGFKAGQFTGDDLDNIDYFSFSLGYKPLAWLGVEVESGSLYNSDIKGDYYGGNVILEPFSQWRFSPILSLGGGMIDFESQPELTTINFEEESFYRIGLSVNYYLGRNFVVQPGYSLFNINSQNDERLRQWNIGFNAFF